MGIHSITGNISARLHRSSTASSRDKEKNFILEWNKNRDGGPSLGFDEICEQPAEKIVGHSSKDLQESDFELIKTLGTGTFARVWLVRVANAKREDQDKVFALKKLRKVDGQSFGHYAIKH